MLYQIFLCWWKWWCCENLFQPAPWKIHQFQTECSVAPANVLLLSPTVGLHLAQNISNRNRNTHHFCTPPPHFVTLFSLQPHSQLISLPLLASVGNDRSLSSTQAIPVCVCVFAQTKEKCGRLCAKYHTHCWHATLQKSLVAPFSTCSDDFIGQKRRHTNVI